MTIKCVLLVCSGNTCRSPMAAGLLKDLWDQSSPGWDLTVTSAGTGAFPGLEASPHAVTAMRGRGIDLTGHRSRSVEDELLAKIDLVLAMTQRHKGYVVGLRPDLAGRVFTVGEYAGAGQDVPDPFGGSLSDYEATAITIEKMMRRIVERIQREGKAGQ